MNDAMHILAVDDRPENLTALRSILDSPMYRLFTAGSGDDALRVLLRQDFGLIIMDVQMPGMDGFQTARMIRTRERVRQIPIIFLTANMCAENLALQGYEVGAMDYLLKPISPELLRAKVAVFAELHRTTSELVRVNDAMASRVRELEAALGLVKTLRSLIPICSWCKKVRDDKGYWDQVEKFVSSHTDFEFSHGICPECSNNLMERIERKKL